MRLKKIFAVIMLSCFCLISPIALMACDGGSLADIETNYQTMEQYYQDHNTVFLSGNLEGISTKVLLTYGTHIDSQIDGEQSGSASKCGYLELETKYNVILAISDKYIMDNKNYVLNLAKSTNNTKKVVKSLKAINTSMENYFDVLEEFVQERNEIAERFAMFTGSFDDNTSLAYLRRFKRVYGELLDANIEIASRIADVIDAIEIFDVLLEEGASAENTNTLKNYIAIKMLSIYSDFMINKVENQIYWNATTQTPTKSRIDALMDVSEGSFEDFKECFVHNTTPTKALEATTIYGFTYIVKEFFEEKEMFDRAMDGFDFAELADQTTHDNDLESYKKKNALAEVNLQKMEQFFGISIGNFISEAERVLY